MFDVRIHVQGSDNSEAVTDYVQERVDRLERFNERVTGSKFELRSVKHRSGGKQWVAQFTVQTRGRILRSEMRDHDQRHAIDVAVEKMRKQMRRFHARNINRSRRDSVSLGRYAADQMADVAQESDLGEPGPVVRTKRFEFHPMDVEEAIDQMELLEHDFFVFLDSESGDTQVVYRRKDGTFGLIQST